MQFRVTLIFLLSLLSHFALLAQGIGFDWAVNNSSSVLTEGKHIAADQMGNVIVAGGMLDTMDVDPGPGTQFLVQNSTSNMAPFVQKFDSNGVLQWAFLLSNDSTSATIEDMVVDHAGNIYLVGAYLGYIEVDPGPNTVYLMSSTFASGFVLKIDPNGGFVWAINLDSDVTTRGASIAVDGSGDVAVIGRVDGNIDLDPGPNTALFYSNGGLFVAKYSATSTYLWGTVIEGPWPGPQRADGVTFDPQGNVLVTGSYGAGSDFDPGPSVVQLPGATGNFVLKLTSGGNYVWVTGTAAGGNVGLSTFIRTDLAGNVFTAGIFVDSVDFDPGPGIARLYSKGYGDYFVLKQDPNGNYLWAKALGTPTIEWYSKITTDAAGNLYFVGNVSDTMDADPGPGVSPINVPLYTTTTLLEKLDANGNMVEFYVFGDTISGYHLTFDIDYDPSGALLMTGTFNKPSDFDPNAGVAVLTPRNNDTHIARLHACAATGSLLAFTICDSVTVNNTTYHNAGSYTQLFINSQNCDSILHVQISLLQVDTSVTVGATSLASNAPGALYQWLDCNSGLAVIPGATSQIFTPSLSGNYAVQVTQNGCSAIGSCHAVTVVGVDAGHLGSTAKVHPNPSAGRFTIAFEQIQNEVEFTLSSITGQTLQRQTLQAVQQFELGVPEAAGVYFLDLKDDRGIVSRHKLLKY